jgi:outer membrane protein
MDPFRRLSRPALLTAVLLTSPWLRAQPLRVTLRQAVDLALRQNPQVQVAKLAISAGAEDERLARAALLPQVGASLSETVIRGNIETAFGARFPGLRQHIGPFWVYSPGVQATAPLFDLTLYRRWQASRAATAAITAEETTVREQYVLLVVSQYLGCLRAAADVRAAQSRLELATALHQLAVDLQKNGAGTRIDSLRAEVELQNERQRLIGAQKDAETSLLALARLLNVDSVEISDEMSFFETPEFGGDNDLQSAYQSRPEMRALDARRQALEAQARAARASRLPTLAVHAGYSEQGTTPANPIPVYQYSAELKVPLFTGGRIGAEVAKADIARQQLEQQSVELRNQIAQEVKTAQAELRASHAQVEAANLAVKLAQEEVEQARDRFKAGVASNIEVITAQDELARASDQQIAALYRYNQARADLARATGQMQALYAR